MKRINKGIYPTMPVAFGEDGGIDYDAMGELIEWYAASGVDGIFALCHSTETHCLTMEERIGLGRFVMKRVAGRLSVVMGGVTASAHREQLREAEALAALEPDALVLLTNRIDGERKDCFERNLYDFIEKLPQELPLGAYECPQPYKRVLTDREIALLAESGRFAFIKDTCCDLGQMERRAAIAAGSGFGLYNANIATFLKTLRLGYDGFSGIMANFHPDLFAYVYRHREAPIAEELEPYLTVMSLIECRSYPICCKEYLARYEGLPIKPYCRSVSDSNPQTTAYELEAIHLLTERLRSRIREAGQ